MKFAATGKAKLREKISSAVASDTPLRDLASNLSQVARSALNEANTLTVEQVSIRLKRLPKNLDGFRVVHLSDIHHSPFTDLEHIRRAVEISNRLKPNMFVLTGDFVSHESKYIAPVAKVLGELESEFGSFACLGNHDHWTDAPLVTDLLRRENIRVLTNEGFRFTARGAASFWLCGVDDYQVGRTDLRAALRGSYPDEMKMLLAHNPKTLNRAARASVDLMFSGHTHGGQVKLRAGDDKRILQRRRKFASGLYRRKETQVYITRGIGTVVLPVRYGCPPEVSLIELRSV
ncbi:MAG: metallophosphoesterase [Acidobacteria bacterium]|jgi:predicted MPP superfamily phosphohydrolase|nr:metallophosphoesterase [Acidobacteriota bacterium]